MLSYFFVHTIWKLVIIFVTIQPNPTKKSTDLKTETFSDAWKQVFSVFFLRFLLIFAKTRSVQESIT